MLLIQERPSQPRISPLSQTYISQSPRLITIPFLVTCHTSLKVAATPIEDLTAREKNSSNALGPRNPDIIPHHLDYAPDFSKDAFIPWPTDTNPDGSNISTENWRGTKIFGWDGCNVKQQKILVETFQHFHKLANQEALWKDIDWNAPAARDIWGHATDDRKAVLDSVKLQIKQIFESVQQVYDRNWWAPPYTPILEPPSPPPGSNAPAPAPPPPKTGPPSPPGSVSKPNLHGPGCDDCLGNIGSSDCKAKDLQCLIGQCKNDKSCQECKIDCAGVGQE